MTLFRSQVILKHANGLPKDNVTNTFWITSPGAATEAEAEAVAELVRGFYIDDQPGAFTNLGAHLSPAIRNDTHEIKVAPIDVETGADTRGQGLPPLWVEPFDFIGRVAPAVGAPAEVALVLSYKNVAPGNVPPARKRGRIYYGPLATADVFMSGNAARPTADLAGTLVNAGLQFITDVTAAGKTWVVYSRPYEGRDVIPRPGNPRGDLPAIAARVGVTYPVTTVHVDNSFDTIRKRGEAATARYTGV